VISDSITALCVDVLEIKKPSLNLMIDSIDVDMNIDNYFVKGCGAIALEVDIDGLVFYLLIPDELFSCDIEKLNHSKNSLDRVEIEDFQIHDREVQITALFEKTSLKYKDLINLKRNDVLVLDHKISAKIKLNLSDTTFCDAQLGSLNGNKAVLLN
ncbi:MAG: FliM/FliN family flagellar motor switch protein, partial [Gammaproteobacteria bacterium]